ncbi:MFS transporter [Sphingobium sp. BS19]|uniref:MFS transporter n=1 Tax=Sphingobium sp. BS19 TaxID=3018973 RepID=UPI002493C11A|nr:MFS transporter [Sphingobium sp. BS19]
MQLVLARMGVGAAESVASPASVSLISDSFPLHQRNTAINIYYAGAPAGQLVIFVLGGWILMHFEWRAVFLVAGLPGLMFAALLFFTCREPLRGNQDTHIGSAVKSVNAKAPRLVEVMHTIVRDPALRYALLGNMIVTGVNSTLVLWLTSFLVRIHELPVSRAAIWVGLGYGLSQTVAALAVGPFADRYSRSLPSRLARIPAVASVLALAAGIVMALSSALGVALAALILFSFIGGFLNGPSYALILSLAKPQMRGSVMATSKLLVILIGSGLFPFLTGAISDAVGTGNSIQPAILATISLLAVAPWFFMLAGRCARVAELAG